MTDRFAERRQQRLRGAGTHAIVQRGLDFFASLASPLRSSRGASSSSDVGDRDPDSSTQDVSAAAAETPRNDGRYFAARQGAAPPSASSAVSAPVSGGGDQHLRRRMMPPPSSSPSKNIDPRLLYAGYQDASGDDDGARMPQAGPSRSPIATTTTTALRRQERMRGAGTHTIAPRSAGFRQDVSFSSASFSLHSPDAAVQPDRVGAGPGAGRKSFMDLERRRQERMRGAGTHSIAARSVAFPAASPSSSLTMAPSQDGDQPSHDHRDAFRGDLETPPRYDVEQRRRERMRGAGSHAIARRSIAFRPQDQPSMDTTETSERDLSMQTSQARGGHAAAEAMTRLDMDQRRQERMRGAGSHAVARRSVAFEQDAEASMATTATATANDVSDMGAGPGPSSPAVASSRTPLLDLDQRRQERMRGAGNHAIAPRDVAFQATAMDSSDMSTPASARHPRLDGGDGADTLKRDGFPVPRQSTPTGNDGAHGVGQDDYLGDAGMDFDDYGGPDDGYSAAIQSQGALPRHDDAVGRFDVQITGKRGRGRPRKGDTAAGAAAKRRRHAVHGELADETVVGDADTTMREAQQTLLVYEPRPMAPWTLSKAAVTPAEVQAMKKELRGAVNLALGRTRADKLRAVRLNDADVLWSAVKKEMSRMESQPDAASAGASGWLADTLGPAVLAMFTRLSRQAAERAQLIAQLREARRTKLAMRKAVYAKRRRVLVAARAIEALQAAEERRATEAVAADSMRAFLTELRATAQSTWA